MLYFCMAWVVWCLGTSTPGFGQAIKGEKLYTATQGMYYINDESGFVSLKTALNKIEKSHNITFFYKWPLVGDKKVPKSVLEIDDLSKELGSLLADLGLTYKKHTDRTYLILERERPNGYSIGEYNYQEVVRGQVSDGETGETIPGVNILVKGTTTGTTTDAEGRFEVIVSSLNDTLVFSFIGYERLEVPVNGQTELNVTLKSEILAGDEVVVVGYGEQRRSSLTAAISSVPIEELNRLPVGNVQQALQGRVAGLQVRNNGGPGEEPIIQIRGISSINYATDPLYVVDGLPTGNIGSIDSQDIESVEVLKDASAAAIYGSRATNGVILITTKKGNRDNRLTVNYESYAGTESPWKTIDLLNTEQYLEYERALNGAAGIDLPPRLQGNNLSQPIYEGASQTYAQTNTDWQDVYFRNGLLTNHQLSLGGGNEATRFYLSGGYFKQDGIAEGLNNQRGNFRINSEHVISSMFSVGENLYLSYGRQRYDNTGGNRTRLVNVIRSLPYLPAYDPTTNGGYRTAENSIDGADPTNPVQDAKLLGQAHNNTTKITGTAYLNVDLVPWLNFRSSFGLDHMDGFQHQFAPIYNSVGNSNSVATITDERNRNTTLLFTQQLTVDQTIDNHHFNVVGVYEYQDAKNFNETASGNQATNELETLAGATNVANQTSKNQARLISFVGRLTYDYDEKYLFNFAIRRDGLSIWAPGNKWANFPSGSVGWRIDREAFMQNQSLISELKLRGGYGITGLNGLLIGDSYPWQVRIQGSAATYPFNNDNDVGNASYYNALGNSEIEWEKTSQWNVGVDLGLFANRITFTADYYRRYTDNLLLEVPTPTSFGLNGGGVLANVGEMKNNGLDVELGYHKVGGEFTWNVTGLMSFARNEVVSLNTPNAAIGAGGDQDFGGGDDITRTQAGEPIQSFYGWVVDGIFQDQSEIDELNAAAPGGVYQAEGTAPGDIRFRDLNDDKVIDSADRTFIGSYIPDFSYSLNFNGNYKNFDLSFFIQGVQGNDIFNASRIISEGMARLFGAGTAVLDAWTPQNTNTDVPRAISGDPNGNGRPSTRWIEDGSYLRLKNIQLGYNVPATTLTSLTNGTISRLRVYVASQNLLTFTGYKGWDPEIGSKNTTLTNGIDYGQYPSARAFLVGLQVSM